MSRRRTGIAVPALMVLRADLRRRWRAWLVLGVITGVTLGCLMAAVVGARRTASAFDRFATWAQAADVTAQVGGQPGGEAVARVPGVAEVARAGLVPGLATPVIDGQLTMLPTDASIVVVDDRYGVDIERARVVEGRRPVVGALEALVNSAFLDQLDVDVGDRVEFVTFSDAVVGRFESFEALAAAFGTDPSLGRLTAVTIVGRGVRAGDLARDEASEPAYMALDRRSVASLLGIPLAYVEHAFDHGHQVSVRFERGADVDAVLARVRAVSIEDVELAEIRANVADAERPYVAALVAFAVLAGLAVVVVIGSALVRQSVADSTDDPILGFLGAERGLLAVVAAGRAATVGAVGVVVAVAVAVGASPLFPLGPVAAAEPHPGLAVDMAVLLPASLTVIAAAVTLGVLASRRRSGDPARSSPGTLSSALTRSLPLALGIGLRFAFPARGRARLVMRSTLIAVAVAIFGGYAVAVFTSSLDDLLDTPRRHGWGWDLALTCSQGNCDLPLGIAGTLRATRGIEAWSFLTFTTLEFDGRPVPVVATGLGRGDLQPLSVSEGRPPATPDEVALGAATMRHLHVDVGDEVTVGSRGHALRVVGRAVFSGLGPADSSRASLGEGAGMTAEGLLKSAEETSLPDAVVAVVDGELDPVARALRNQLPQLKVLELRRPAGLNAWPELRGLPLLLGLLLGILALATLAHGLAVSNRIHRQDLAVLHALGMPARQLTGVVIGQSLAVLAASFLLGAPLGVFTGIAAWRALTGRIGVTSAAALRPIPAAVSIAVALAAVLVVTLVAAPWAGRRRTAALRSE